ncbi:MAG: class I SAM-dependent methyltransferase [Candidatus Omnitrophota bacterium]
MLENIILRLTMNARIEGPLKLDRELFQLFLSLPEDPLPNFQGPTPRLRGRSKEHPRYGRWMHAFVKFYKPDIVVEIGTNAGGTAVGIAKGLIENGKGRLICIDNGEGIPKSFPNIARKNIKLIGLEDDRFDLICEDSQSAVPRIAVERKRSVGVYLVDGAHMFEAALADIENGLRIIRSGGFILVHDVDLKLGLGDEASREHPHPVYEAFQIAVKNYNFEWCILKFIRKHLGIIRVN